MKRGYHWGEPGVGMILKWITKKEAVNILTEFNRIKVWSSGVLS